MFESIASLKQETDQEDEYRIYDINRGSNNRPAYVFKTTIMDKVYEANSSFYVNQCNTGKL